MFCVKSSSKLLHQKLLKELTALTETLKEKEIALKELQVQIQVQKDLILTLQEEVGQKEITIQDVSRNNDQEATLLMLTLDKMNVKCSELQYQLKDLEKTLSVELKLKAEKDKEAIRLSEENDRLYHLLQRYPSSNTAY
jgi:hypothetical protein